MLPYLFRCVAEPLHKQTRRGTEVRRAVLPGAKMSGPAERLAGLPRKPVRPDAASIRIGGGLSSRGESVSCRQRGPSWAAKSGFAHAHQLDRARGGIVPRIRSAVPPRFFGDFAMDCKYPNRNGRQGYKRGCRCQRCRLERHKHPYTEKQRAIIREHCRVDCKLKDADKRARRYGVMCRGFPRKLLRIIYRNCPPGWTVDHIVPMCCGGLHHPMNVQYMTLRENLRKGRKTFWLCEPGTTMDWWAVLGIEP